MMSVVILNLLELQLILTYLSSSRSYIVLAYFSLDLNKAFGVQTIVDAVLTLLGIVL